MKVLCLREGTAVVGGQDVYLQPGQEYDLEENEFNRLAAVGVVIMQDAPTAKPTKPTKPTRDGDA